VSSRWLVTQASTDTHSIDMVMSAAGTMVAGWDRWNDFLPAGSSVTMQIWINDHLLVEPMTAYGPESLGGDSGVQAVARRWVTLARRTPRIQRCRMAGPGTGRPLHLLHSVVLGHAAPAACRREGPPPTKA
jgi:hypothetical protein